MKKTLLLGAMALMLAAAATATTPVKRSDAKVNHPQLQRMAMPQAQMKTNTMRAPGSLVMKKAPKKEAFLENWYRRPAGAFYVDAISVDGDYGYSYSAPFLFAKPFTDYTYYGFVTGADENTNLAWDVYKYDGDQNMYSVDYDQNVTVNYSMETDPTPIFYAVDGPLDGENSEWFVYKLVDHNMGGSYESPIVESETPVNVFSLPSEKVMNDDGSEVDYWASSRSFVGGGRDGNNYYLYSYYAGATPAEGNENGWWFGKNGNHIDGLGQAFEKPTSPYLLKKVGLYTVSDVDRLNADNAKLTCKVYKLDEIPAYNDSVSVVLNEVPGELIVSGEGYITPSTIQDNNGFVEFTLFGVDEEDPELTYEYTPTIDCPILVVIEGYNDNPDLQDFSVCVASDEVTDEGYGEQAFLKYPVNVVRIDEETGDTVKDEQGKPVYDFTGTYRWRGLNNFFQSGAMKTGFTLFLSTENPFITFNYSIEDGEHTFPVEGGDLVKDVEIDGEIYQIEGIDFFSWYGSEDYLLTWNGNDEIPDWLNIELEDVEGDEYSGYEVYAAVSAEPLPAGVSYREAVVRFEIPGDYIEYKFMQGEKIGIRGDVNGDGDVSIADVNALIDIILGGEADAETMVRADVNTDGDISIADINALIDILLTQ